MASPRDEDEEPTLRTERRAGLPDRRADRADNIIVNTAKNADAGLSLLWRLGSMLVTLLCTAFVIGTMWSKFGEMSRQIAVSDASIQKLQQQLDQMSVDQQLRLRDDTHYRADMEKRQIRDEEFRHTVRAYEFAVMGALREVQGKVGIKPMPLPEIKGDD